MHNFLRFILSPDGGFKTRPIQNTLWVLCGHSTFQFSPRRSGQFANTMANNNSTGAEPSSAIASPVARRVTREIVSERNKVKIAIPTSPVLGYGFSLKEVRAELGT